MKAHLAACSALLLYATSASAQTRPLPWLDSAAVIAPRPVVRHVFETPAFSRAVAAGTRSRDGRPGARAWVNHARYEIDASLDPSTHTITGTERVVYSNRSPSSLSSIRVHLRQNAFAPESPRRDRVIPTGGMNVSRVLVNGTTATHRISGTVMNIPLATSLAAGDSITLEFAWSYEVPLTPSDGRQGRDEGLYFAGYWYPQVAVYDDVHGWVADPYLMQAEFYMDHADYEVRISAPRGWAVGATGKLQNAEAVLPADVRAKLADARTSGRVVNIAAPGALATLPGLRSTSHSTWHFRADNVRDFSWGASNRYAWDATRALVARSTGAADTVDIHSFYRLHPPAAAWPIGGARYTRDAIEQLSRYLWPYPWPVMSSMEGVLTGGGMEFPMMTLMQPWVDTLSLAGDLMHETGHMWYPMSVGSNETHFPWMDEGFTQFNTAQAMRVLYGEPRTGGRPNDSEPGQRRQYVNAAASGDDQLLMQHGDLFPQELYNVMYYNKTAQALVALRGILGDEMFRRAFREYGERWNGRHPYPYDFFNTFENVTGRDLGWFWSAWFFQPWSLDQAIGPVTTKGTTMTVSIEDRGLAPMPVVLSITRANGRTEMRTLPVDVWLGGKRAASMMIEDAATVTRIEIDAAAAFPDIDRNNQLWIRGGR